MITLSFAGNATTGQVREITHAGRRYLVSPVVALREGILNDIYVSAAEFGKFATSWQGRPVPISHPKADGSPISANTPDIWANDVLGHLWNVEVDAGALKGEIWIDLDKAQLMGPRAMQIVNKLRANQSMEVSTGYFCEMEVAPGQWGGKSYTGVARNIRPDHLALLPDETGACSWADGCGTPRVNSSCGCKGEQPMEEQTPADVSANERNLFDKFLGWLGGQKPSGPQNQTEHQEGEPMAKTEVIANEEAQEVPAAADAQGAPAPAAQPPVAQDAVLARIAALEGELAQTRETIKGLTANQNEERAGLVAGIVANCRGAFVADDLTRFDTNKLRDIYGSYLPRDYSANAGALRQNFGPEDEELLMVWPQFEQKGA
jgi:hypothetical protein